MTGYVSIATILTFLLEKNVIDAKHKQENKIKIYKMHTHSTITISKMVHYTTMKMELSINHIKIMTYNKIMIMRSNLKKTISHSLLKCQRVHQYSQEVTIIIKS